MAWFMNFYKCTRCRRRWTDEWSCMCDDECPHCGMRDMTPHKSEDMTTLIEEEGKEFVVLWSPETAEHEPSIASLAVFPTREGTGISVSRRLICLSRRSSGEGDELRSDAPYPLRLLLVFCATLA